MMKLYLSIIYNRSMLKGIKKGKTSNEIQDKKQIKQQKLEQKIQRNINLYKNTNSLKEQCILEDEKEEQQKSHQIFQEKHTISQYITKEYQKLKYCAQQILQNFLMGKSQKVRQVFKDFEIFQDRINKIKNLGSNSYQARKDLTELQQNNKPRDSQQKDIKKKLNLSKFGYEFNYQSDQEIQKNKNKKKRPIMKSQKVQQYCIYCPQNQQLKLISASNYIFLAFPKRKTFKKYWHFILAPVQHQQSTIGLNQDVLTQITNYKKCLLQMFDQKKMHVVFFQQFSSQNSHIYIQCLVIPLTKGQDLPFFFKQSLQSVEGNWTTHKNIIKIQKQKGGLTRQIPKKMKYFYIDFSLGYGYAHVIQNERFWNRQFCYQILATALGLQKYQVKTTEEFSEEQYILKDKQFQKMWQKYDWTKLI